MSLEVSHNTLERRRQTMVAVIDIGSNSLRLVIYDSVTRAPHLLFNEKVMCALGRGMNATGRLNPEGVVLARDNIERFVALATQLGVGELEVLATSAVRDATDGPDFVAMLKSRYNIDVRVISGEDEAKLAAAGIYASMIDADGIVGDLGGGSVELVTVGGDLPPQASSLPIGPVRLMGETLDDSRPRAQIDQAIAQLSWLPAGRGKTFYAVGGAWRALARIHMEQDGYPLHVIQGYRIGRADAENFLSVMGRQSRRSLDKLLGISKKRLETLPLASYVLYRLLRVIQPAEIIFSAYGLREGHLFQKLSPAEQALDPLLAAVARIAEENPRFGGGGQELARWSDPLFSGETPGQRRLREAAALLSDIGWSEHPDYRTEQALTRVLRMPVPGMEHTDRVFIATVLHARYGSDTESLELRRVEPLIDAPALARARGIGLAFRLGYTLTGGAPGLIQRTALSMNATTLTLSVPEHTAIYTGEAIRRRLDNLARALGRRATLSIEGSAEELILRRQA